MNSTYDHELVKRMIEEAVKAEREACAMLCDQVSNNTTIHVLEKYSALEIAKAIRTRKQP